MGQLLKKVISTEDRGLIGITENNEEIPLSAPNPKIYVANHSKNQDPLFLSENAKAILIQTSRSVIYYAFEKMRIEMGLSLMPYNVYTKRK
jgi:hypothetical protein